MYFDKFDICEAYFVYMMLWHSGGLTERDRQLNRNDSISCQLHRIKFTPSPLIRDENDLTENGREIYDALVEKWEQV